jgi:deoxyribodipyrimidine photolyase
VADAVAFHNLKLRHATRCGHVCAAVRRAGARVADYKRRVVVEGGELRTRAGIGYLAYTPFRNASLDRSGAVAPVPERAAALPPPVPDVELPHRGLANWPAPRRA